jgi:Fur family ferric uptake transcriptional regulator
MYREKQIFRDYILNNGLKYTGQRDQILDSFLSVEKHISVEELYDLIKKNSPEISYATVYRTMKLLSECGMAKESKFQEGITRYEHACDHGHHDHLLCLKCGTIKEFENHQIELIQRKIAEENNFKVEDHKLEIYGICSRCQ